MIFIPPQNPEGPFTQIKTLSKSLVFSYNKKQKPMASRSNSNVPKPLTDASVMAAVIHF